MTPETSADQRAKRFSDSCLLIRKIDEFLDNGMWMVAQGRCLLPQE